MWRGKNVGPTLFGDRVVGLGDTVELSYSSQKSSDDENSHKRQDLKMFDHYNNEVDNEFS